MDHAIQARPSAKADKRARTFACTLLLLGLCALSVFCASEYGTRQYTVIGADVSSGAKGWRQSCTK